MTFSQTLVRLTVAAGLLAGAAAAHADTVADTLPKLNIDKSSITVSGISSGGYMAVQTHVAYSGAFKGVGVVAGGPYGCAVAPANAPSPLSGLPMITAGTNICTNVVQPHLGNPDPQAQIDFTKAISTPESMSKIDSPKNLCGSRVYQFQGTADTTLLPVIGDALNTYYEKMTGCADAKGKPPAADHQLYVKKYPVVHSFVSPKAKTSCDDLAKLPDDARAPYICTYQDVDTAKEILTQLYGSLKPAAATFTAANLKTFKQSAYLTNPYSDSKDSMNEFGHLYVPTACADGKTQCKLHVAYHGCLQSQDNKASGDAFYTTTNYNEWAETNNVVILYPQARMITGTVVAGVPTGINPQGCWDFWGYNRSDFYTRSGPQLQAVGKMVNALVGTNVVNVQR